MKTLTLITLALLAPLAAKADVASELKARKIFAHEVTENFDGSVTMHWPAIDVNGKRLFIAQYDPSNVEDGSTPSDTIAKENYQLANNLCRAAGFGAATDTYSSPFNDTNRERATISYRNNSPSVTAARSKLMLQKVSCAKAKAEPQVAGGMEEVLKHLREVNGIDLRPDGSVVIDSRIAKKITIKGSEDTGKPAQSEPAT